MLGLEPVDWNARFRLLREQLLAAEERAAADETKDRREGTTPSHPLADYAGEYGHAGYGSLRVESTPEGLELRFNAVDSALEHWHYDVFRMAGGIAEGMTVAFGSDVRGHVHEVRVPFEPAARPIVFERRPPSEMRDPGFLGRFTGEYELSGAVLKVRLRETGELTMEVPGQPIYTLVPYREGEFTLDGVDGYLVRFVVEGEQATELVSIQPNGVFRAFRSGEGRKTR